VVPQLAGARVEIRNVPLGCFYRTAAISMLQGVLKMDRGEVAQEYLIERSTWGFHQDDKYAVPVLSLAVRTKIQDSIFPQEGAAPHDPMWSLDIWARSLSADLLRPGCRFQIPESFDDFTGVVFTTFYYDEHEGTTDNIITVRSLADGILDLFIEGHIRHQFASMPPTRITVNAQFMELKPRPAINAAHIREALPPHQPPCGATVLQTRKLERILKIL
jgi:hypothetical protein